MTPPVAAGLDLGGTNLKAAIIDSTGRILAQRTVPSRPDRGPNAVVEDFAGLVDQLTAIAKVSGASLAGVGIGSPGPLSQHTGRIIRAANLPGWTDVPLRDLLAERLQLPVVLDNDGNAAAFGEAWIGAGRGIDDLVMLTLGTGVGAGVILDGAVFHGHHENAAELGHTIVNADGPPCPCGQRGCLEQYASAGAIVRRVVAAIERGEPCKLGDAVRSKQQIGGKEVAQAAESGDTLCLRVWDDACRYLAVACINIQHTYNPPLIVLGGGMSSAGEFLLDRVQAELTERRWHLHDDVPTVALAKLGDDAGVIGAAAFCLNRSSRKSSGR